MGYAVTATITITAGAQSSQPSRRSARAPSDSGALRRRPATGSWAVTGGVTVVMSPPLSACAGRSRSQPLSGEGVVDLRSQVLLSAHRVDGAGRRHEVRDRHGHDLVQRGLGPHGPVVDLLQD